MAGKTKPNAVPVVVQEPDKPIAEEIIAKAIIDISEATKKALNAGLKREAIVTLIHANSSVGKPHIRLVLNNLESLRQTWCTR